MMCPEAAFVFFVLIFPSLYKTRSKRTETANDHTVQKHSSCSCLRVSVARFLMACALNILRHVIFNGLLLLSLSSG